MRLLLAAASMIPVAMAATLRAQGNDMSMVPCEAHKACRDCTSDINCGWCEADQTCYEGVELGPIYGSCSAWTHSFCHNEACADRTDCASCLASEECGWCAATGACEEGNAEKSTESACPATRWLHKESKEKPAAMCKRAVSMLLDDIESETM